jgi:hypothetical protein
MQRALHFRGLTCSSHHGIGGFHAATWDSSELYSLTMQVGGLVLPGGVQLDIPHFEGTPAIPDETLTKPSCGALIHLVFIFCYHIPKALVSVNSNKRARAKGFLSQAHGGWESAEDWRRALAAAINLYSEYLHDTSSCSARCSRVPCLLRSPPTYASPPPASHTPVRKCATRIFYICGIPPQKGSYR